MALAWAGTFLPAEAGIQDGLRATTAWWLSPVFNIRDALVQLEPVPDLDGPKRSEVGLAARNVPFCAEVQGHLLPRRADVVFPVRSRSSTRRVLGCS